MFEPKIDTKDKWVAYTDGSCDNLSPYGEGGSAYVILKDGFIVKEQSKYFLNTTNNRMEMLAIISAVNSVPSGASLVVFTDSQYCIKMLTGSFREVNKNADLIHTYHRLASKLSDIEFVWVKGHNGDEFNEYVDSLAHAAYEKAVEVYIHPATDTVSPIQRTPYERI